MRLLGVCGCLATLSLSKSLCGAGNLLVQLIEKAGDHDLLGKPCISPHICGHVFKFGPARITPLINVGLDQALDNSAKMADATNSISLAFCVLNEISRLSVIRITRLRVELRRRSLQLFTLGRYRLCAVGVASDRATQGGLVLRELSQLLLAVVDGVSLALDGVERINGSGPCQGCFDVRLAGVVSLGVEVRHRIRISQHGDELLLLDRDRGIELDLSLVNGRVILCLGLELVLLFLGGLERLLDGSSATARDGTTQDADRSRVDVLAHSLLAGHILVSAPAFDERLDAFGHALTEAALERFHRHTADTLATLDGVHQLADSLGVGPGINRSGSNARQPDLAQAVLLARQSSFLHGVTVDRAQLLSGVEEGVGSSRADRAVDGGHSLLERRIFGHASSDVGSNLLVDHLADEALDAGLDSALLYRASNSASDRTAARSSQATQSSASQRCSAHLAHLTEQVASAVRQPLANLASLERFGEGVGLFGDRLDLLLGSLVSLEAPVLETVDAGRVTDQRSRTVSGLLELLARHRHAAREVALLFCGLGRSNAATKEHLVSGLIVERRWSG